MGSDFGTGISYQLSQPSGGIFSIKYLFLLPLSFCLGYKKKDAKKKIKANANSLESTIRASMVCRTNWMHSELEACGWRTSSNSFLRKRTSKTVLSSSNSAFACSYYNSDFEIFGLGSVSSKSFSLTNSGLSVSCL